ncbi:MAG: hypothetical protein E7627_05035 [Ruminococcaceae bacterium]|nr:hypothetical protein [Oscillospiraceae bacterium]
MLERAVVVETDGKIAIIEVKRSSMCEGCHKLNGDGDCAGHCEISGLIAGNGKTVRTKAVNQIGAVVGDKVRIETDSKRVIGYAALVFMLPIIICALFYYVGNIIFSTMTGAVLSAVAGFFLTFLGIAIYDRSKRKKLPEIVITDIIE